MVSVEKAVIARLSKGNAVFEILVDADKALEMKKGREYSMENVLAVNGIFKDAKKGERASDHDLEKSFSTRDIFKVAAEIIRSGQIQLTTGQRNRMFEEKKKEIADIISKQGIDPKTKLPHPATRIINAMDQVHVNIDPFRPAKEQIEGIVSKLQEIMPIRIEKIEIAVKIPVTFAGRASHALRTMAHMKSEEWRSDYWFALIEIPAGMQAAIYEKLNDLTSGNVEVKVVKRDV